MSSPLLSSSGSIAVPSSVLFVCTGNICRSPTAHALLLHKAAMAGVQMGVDSAAVSDEERGNPIDVRSLAELRRRGIPVPAHRARQVRAADFEKHAWIVGMTGAHCNVLRRLAGPDRSDRVHLMMDFVEGRSGEDVPDPWYGGPSDFIRAFELIDVAVDGLLARWGAGGRC